MPHLFCPSRGVLASFAGTLAALVLTISASAQASYVWRNVEIVGGGFVPGLVFNLAEPNLIYARTDIGGAYRWNQSTGRWIPLTDWIGWDDWNLTGIVSLASDPVDPNRVYLAAGTYTNDWTSQNGAILRSSDRGVSWQRTDLPFKLGGNMPGRGMGERLVIDPNRNSILYLGAPSGHGLWRSTDFGASWVRVTSFPATGTYIEGPSDPYLGDQQGVVWVTFDPRTGTSGNPTQTIYVGVAEKNGPSIYRSTNGGSTWSAVPGQPIGYLPHKGVLEVATGTLFVGYSDNGGPYGGEKGDVWKLNTASGAWTLISPIPSSSGDNYFGYSGLTIDRQVPGTVMVTGYSSWWPDTQIWRSKDGGATWSRIWDWTRYPNRSFRYTMDISAAPWLYWGGGAGGGGRPGAEVYPKLGWMTESLEIDPHNSNRMMYGTGATIYGSENLTVWDQSTTSQITIKVMAQGLEETAIQEIVSPPAGAPLLSGMYDIYGFVHQRLDVVPNAFYANPQIATVTIDFAELNPSFIFRAGDGDAANGVKSAGYSTNGGASWTSVMKEPTGTTNGGTIAVNANGTIVVWSPDGAGVHYTTSNGGTWTASTGIPAGAQVRSDRVNPNTFYGFFNGTFYVSTNGGASFTATGAAGLPSSGQFKTVAGQPGHVWLAGGTGGLWRSTDSGASFAKLSLVQEADTIGFGKAATGQSYPALYTSARIGGVRGIFRSDDVGASWIRINDDQHQYAWTGKAITGDPRVYGRVYIATNGRGIIYGDLAGGGDPMVPAAPSALTATAVSTTQINLSWTDNSANETTFIIERATNSGFTSNLVSTSVAANTTTHSATGLTANTTYYFRVRAANEAGDSAHSNTATAKTARR
jgi:xyloglucan-specific exo-beta-1,4-glucanase